MFRSRLTRSTGLALAIVASCVPSAFAGPSDLRTPDAVEAAKVAPTKSSTPTDLRTPDAASAGQVASSNASFVNDRRTPDARDHGEGRGTFSAPDVTIVKVTDPSPVAGGFDWEDAGIGAGSLLGLVLVGVGGTLAITHYRHRPNRSARPA